MRPIRNTKLKGDLKESFVEKRFLEEKRAKDSFMNMMAQMLNKYGRMVLDGKDREGGDR